jgi:hypothetical protein
MAALLILLVFFGFLIVLPLLLVGFLVRVLVGLALIPLKLVGFALRLSLGLAFGLVALVLAGTLLLLPLLPFVALAFVVWMIIRLMRRQPAARLSHPTN